MTKLNLDDPVALIQQLTFDQVQKKLQTAEEALAEVMKAEITRHQEALRRLKEEHKPNIDALRQLKRVVSARDGKMKTRNKSRRSDSWAPKIAGLLQERGPLTAGHIIKALNGTTTVYSVLSRGKSFVKQNDGRWGLTAEGETIIPKIQDRGEVTAANTLAVLSQRGPLTLSALADRLGYHPELVLKLLRGDRRFQEDRSGEWCIIPGM